MTLQLDFLPEIGAIFMLMFARIGTMLMLMPALGETSVPMRVRLVLALMLTLALYPIGSTTYPANLMDDFPRLLLLMGSELLLGFVIGLCAKMITFALQTAGVIIASQSSLAMALGTDVTNSGQQGALVSNYLSILGITLIFVTDTHYLIIAAMHDSFVMFPPGGALPISDLAAMVTQTVADVFSIAVRMSAPFIVVGIVFYFGLGLLNKLMPQMQIFFIAMPVNIAIGLGLLLVLLTTMMTFYMSHFEQAVGKLTLG
ncbi:flagellar type III secretion system protein FliR [Roseibium polysiphoniae]|uniref:Flagellar biosynthetic protein FliR n=1 Tax=Roseibium polysiphoniae TaxID=2571221 RepID=A0A927KCD0_9HYPH|nr:flagellar biosynthetic protein FliR [Roseibium polysiphoniae]MBD8876464.1 flagellar type III secretion system protein FliR [Roseibium polysiphoniae]MBS8260177.1 flagellar type III secretion system protein FliR [Roseibium polysiphoniae]